MQTVKPTGLGWRQTARAIHRTKGKRLARPDRMDVVTRTIVVTKGIVHVEATRRKSHHSNKTEKAMVPKPLFSLSPIPPLHETM